MQLKTINIIFETVAVLHEEPLPSNDDDINMHIKIAKMVAARFASAFLT